MGSAPFLGGGFGHFFAYAPEKFEYAINRYAMEAKRQFDVLNRQLAEQRVSSPGADYRIADIAIWPWYGGVALAAAIRAPTSSSRRTNMSMSCAGRSEIDARPAVKRGRIVNKLTGDEREQLHERHDASDFELRTEDKIQRRAEAEDSPRVKDDAI